MARVLVVEGDASHAGLLKALLESYQCAVMEASTGLSAMRILNDYVPDLILVDLILPGIDGTTLIKLLKTSSRTSQVPVVVLASDCTQQEKDLLLTAGCNEIVFEPLFERKLNQIVNKYIQNSEHKTTA